MHYLTFLAILAVAAVALWWLPQIAAKRTAFSAVIAAMLAWTGMNSFYQVPAGYIGLQYAFGAIVGKTKDGLQVVPPWRTVVPASARVQSSRFEKLESFSRESQDIFVTATINYHVSPDAIVPLYTDVGSAYFDILVKPRVHQYLKDETVKLSSVDIAPNREQIRKSVRDRLTAELRAHSIVVDDFLLDNISFSREFQAAIEAKQAQTQLALAEQEKVAAEKARAQQAIERAKGEGEAILQRSLKEAEANRAVAASITPELVQYQTAQKLAPNIQVMLVPAGQQFILGGDLLRPARPVTGPATTPAR